jgi:hypothetical protein
MNVGLKDGPSSYLGDIVERLTSVVPNSRLGIIKTLKDRFQQGIKEISDKKIVRYKRFETGRLLVSIDW